MGLGYPSRIVRASLGPELRDNYPVENPESDIGARTFNAAFHQLAGLNTCLLARSVLIAEWTGAAFVVSFQEEAWNSDGAQAHPVLARTAAGVYTYTFASSYLDEDGTAQTTSLVMAKAESQTPMTAWLDIIFARGWIDPVNPLQINVQIFTAAGVAADAKFLLEVG